MKAQTNKKSPVPFNAAPIVAVLYKLRDRTDRPQLGRHYISCDDWHRLAELATELDSPFAPIFVELSKPF